MPRLVADTQKHARLVLPCRIWSLYVKRLGRDYGDHTEKFDPSRPALQSHSR